ncbi:MAG TPA: alpha/beta hydrolase [Streptosporangiaceae bacterium]|nr:alpha/beta hydrolase [Streptosporangiaceae bacterium]
MIRLEGVPEFVEAPFVLPTDSDPHERHGNIDLYLPEGEGPWPAAVFITGGPIPAELEWNRPRDWPMYRGYGGLLSANGLVAAPVQLPLHSYDDFPRAADALAAAVDVVRADPRVDGDRMCLWFFCGGSPLISDWLRNPPQWVRCIGATYPVLGSRPGKELPPRFLPAEALSVRTARPPIVLTRVGLEDPVVASTVAEFVTAAEKYDVALEIIDVPNGRHGFDFLDYTEESREAVYKALEMIRNALK